MTTTALKAAVANLLSCGVRSPDLVTALRSAGFSLDVPVSGGKKRAVKFKLASGALPVFVKMKVTVGVSRVL